MLIGARALQGVGRDPLSPATLTILTTTFVEPKARPRAMGLWSAVAGAGGASGALLGGVLTQELSRRWILLINVPIGVVALVVARTFLLENRAAVDRKPLDVVGALLVTGGLTALVYGLVRTTSVGWSSWQTIVALGAAAVLLAGFVLHEAKVARDPLMPLGMFWRRSIWTANLTMLTLSAALFAMWYFVSLYLQDVLGYSPLQTGTAFLPQTLAIILGAQVSSRLMLRVGPSALLVVGTLSAAGGPSGSGTWALTPATGPASSSRACSERSGSASASPRSSSPRPPGSRRGKSASHRASSTRRARSAGPRASPLSRRSPRRAPTTCCTQVGGS